MPQGSGLSKVRRIELRVIDRGVPEYVIGEMYRENIADTLTLETLDFRLDDAGLVLHKSRRQLIEISDVVDFHA